MIIHEKNSSSHLSASEIDELKNYYKVDEVWYIYDTLSYAYEGYGQMIARIGNLYTHHNMSHCSCYGPLDQFEPENLSLVDLRNRLEANKDFWCNELKELFDIYPELNQ